MERLQNYEKANQGGMSQTQVWETDYTSLAGHQLHLLQPGFHPHTACIKFFWLSVILTEFEPHWRSNNMTTFKSILILFWFFSKYSVKYFLLFGCSKSLTAYINVSNISCGIEKKSIFQRLDCFLTSWFPSLLACLQAASKKKECCSLLLCLPIYLVQPSCGLWWNHWEIESET